MRYNCYNYGGFGDTVDDGFGCVMSIIVLIVGAALVYQFRKIIITIALIIVSLVAIGLVIFYLYRNHKKELKKKSHQRDRQQRMTSNHQVEDSKKQAYWKSIAPKGWKARSGIYFYDDNDIKALHCHRRVIQLFTDDDRAITIPESDINDKYYLINMDFTSANDSKYPDVQKSVLTLITTDKSEVIKVTPRLPEKIASFLKENFLLSDSEKKRHGIVS